MYPVRHLVILPALSIALYTASALAQSAISFDLQRSPTFMEKTGESILTLENQVWNVTAQTLEQVLQIIDVTVVETLDSATHLLAGLVASFGYEETTNTSVQSKSISHTSSSSSYTSSIPGSSSSLSTTASTAAPSAAGQYGSSAPTSSSKSTTVAARQLSSSINHVNSTLAPHARKISRSRSHLDQRESLSESNYSQLDHRGLDLGPFSGIHLGGNLDLGSTTSSSNSDVLNVSSSTNVTIGGGADSSINLTSLLDGAAGPIGDMVNSFAGNANKVTGGILSNITRPDHGDGTDDTMTRAARRSPSDLEWYIELSIGTPAQSIPVLPDTGSSDLIVFSSSCSGLSTTNHSLFNARSSHSYTNMSQTWKGGYADGSGGSGWISADSLPGGSAGTSSSAGMAAVSSTRPQSGKSSTKIIPQLLFALLETVIGDSFDDSSPSGVFGLAQDALCTLEPICHQPSAQSKGITLFSRLVKSGLLAKSALSIKMVKSANVAGSHLGDTLGGLAADIGLVNTNVNDGYFSFGEINENDVVGGSNALTWIPVTSRYYWGSSFDGVYMGDTSIFSWTRHTNTRFIMDTGTTLIFTSYELSFYIHSLIPGSRLDDDSGIFYIPCMSTSPGAPNLFIELGGQRFGVPVSDLAWRKSSDTRLSGQCVSGVQGGMSAFTVLGDMFIKNHLVVLSYGSKLANDLEIGVGNRPDVLPIL